MLVQGARLIYFIVSTVVFLMGLGIIYWVHSRYHLDIRVETVAAPVEGPLISVCVPARNEERNIRVCVESILQQDYPNFELIVLEDRSTDATPNILGDLRKEAQVRGIRFQTIEGAELPAGWAGKPHALHQAARAAHGEWLCFIDADTFLSPQALSAVLAKAVETQAGLFTILTFQLMGTFWEKTVLPLVMTALSVGFSPRKVNDPKTRDAIANGQFILIKRAVYEAIGGYESIKEQIVEDKAISELVKGRGYRLIVADGAGVARTRMYTSLATMWEGWTKNIYLGLSDRPSLLLLGVFGAVLLVVAAIVLPIWPLLGLSWYLHGGGWLALAVIAQAAILWGMLLAARAQVAHGMGISRWWALSTPLGAGVFAAMMLTSAWKVLSGKGVTWKGRVYVP
jgi:chlorobactene glucosyltransferase